jgi:HPt (histidine-containing phosphotransfer) domain-containing protein
MTKNINDNIKLQLLNSHSIDTNLGLKHFNNNSTLYLKILNRFVERNETLDLDMLDADELSTTLHTLKGLSSTLGMVELTSIIKKIENKSDKILINNFTQELSEIINNIKNII